MINAFKPMEAGFYTLFVFFTILFFSGNPLSILPAILLLLAKQGFESFYRADLDRIHRRVHYGDKERTSILRVSIFLALFSVLFAFYFGLALQYAFIALVIFSASRIVHSYQFPADLVLSIVTSLIMMVHSTNLWSMAPVYWFAFFSELSRRSIRQIAKPFGVGSYNLPKLLGVAAAEEFMIVINLLSAIWPVLMSRYAPGLAFTLFSISTMVIAASVYALKVSHVERAEKLTLVASMVFLLALYASYGLQIL